MVLGNSFGNQHPTKPNNDIFSRLVHGAIDSNTDHKHPIGAFKPLLNLKVTRGGVLDSL